jgi:hypothetical protein
MSYDNLSSVSQNVLKFYQQLTGEERRVPFIFGRNNQQCFGYGNRDRCGVYLSAHSNTSFYILRLLNMLKEHYHYFLKHF